MEVIAHQNTTKWHEYTVSKVANGVLEPFDLEAAGIVRVDVVERRKYLSTEADPGGVVLSGSTLKIQWGLLSVSEDRVKPTVYVYKSGDTKGEVLYGPGEDVEIVLRMQPDERPF